jgi:hypothetical protein
VKRAFLVTGAESTGTRLVTRILIGGGCIGDGDHEQRWDSALPTSEPLVVIRRSLPHGGAWPDLERLLRTLEEREYSTYGVITTRDWATVVRSQLRDHQHATSADEAIAHMRTAYAVALRALADRPYWFVSYEALVRTGRAAAERLAEQLELPTFHFNGAIIDRAVIA